MHPLNPVLSRAVIDDITAGRRSAAAARSRRSRPSRREALRDRVARRRAAARAPSPSPRVPLRPGPA